MRILKYYICLESSTPFALRTDKLSNPLGKSISIGHNGDPSEQDHCILPARKESLQMDATMPAVRTSRSQSSTRIYAVDRYSKQDRFLSFDVLQIISHITEDTRHQ
jgi:hypothetical protein